MIQQWGQDRCDGVGTLSSNPYSLFCDANAAVISLFQIIVTNNWHIIMYKAIEVTDSWFVALYFISFFVLGPMLIVNFLLAVFFDMFFGVSMQHQENQDMLLEQEQEDNDDIYYTDIKRSIPSNSDLKNAKLIDSLSKHNMDTVNVGDGNQLPTELGISSLPNGMKILIIKQPINNKILSDSLNT